MYIKELKLSKSGPVFCQPIGGVWAALKLCKCDSGAIASSVFTRQCKNKPTETSYPLKLE
jgi:hypothetical protein